jgi:hypothetical protein
MREFGAQLCEELTLSRDFPAAAQDIAWRNLFWHTRRLGDLTPSLTRTRIEFDPPPGFYPMNPSIATGPDGMVMNVRCVNYRIGHEKPAQTRTRNFLFKVDCGLGWTMTGELPTPPDLPVRNDKVLGIEDIRLWNPHDQEWWFSATSRQHNDQGWCEIGVGRIVGSKVEFLTFIDPGVARRQHEKNWMPVADGTMRLIYSCDPVRVSRFWGTAEIIHMPPVSARHWRGSSQAIPFDGGFLAIIHECPHDLDPIVHKPPYRQRFVWFDQSLQIRKWSWGWEFGHDSAGEYVCGMCEHPDGERLVISYGVLDREAWLATVSKDEVRAILRDVI